VTLTEIEFRETSARHRTSSMPLSHLSIELGHLYAEDYRPGYQHLLRHFERVAPWAEQARETCRQQLPPKVKPRISTCFLIDDYLNVAPDPAEVIDQLRRAAAENGITIDYLARESGCAEADGIPLARLVVDHLVPDPPQNTTGGRPPASESGWLCNGQRSPEKTAPAMQAATSWAPPRENSANPHSIFIDVQLWSEDQDGVRTWSCPFLASVWQLIRLGLLRHHGDAVVRPRLIEEAGRLPADWGKVPPVLQLNPKAPPFSAYRTVSMLRTTFLPVELAVRTILSQISVSPEILADLDARSAREEITLPQQIIQRLAYVFEGG
jgi:hypothetical protein